MKLVKYSETPQVSGLEYKEMRYLKKHSKKKRMFAALAESRSVIDNVRRNKALKEIGK